ncbi:MAG TPA: hypothetical protein VGR33_04075 [Actinomycetota bacterium]|nr:hypothetical protein [Actinomycetota bacterium]
MERSVPYRNRMGTAAYWAVALLLVGFGFLGLFSIGAPFLLMGAAMIVVSPWRNRREVLWPTLVGVWGFVLGYVLVAPLSCETSSSMDPITVCTHVFGIRWYGGNPSLFPAFVIGVISAAIGVAVARYLLMRRRPTAG